MKKMISLYLIVLVLIVTLTGCIENSNNSGITSLKFASVSKELKLNIPNSTTGYVKVEGDNFSAEDIEFVSSNNDIATIVYDKTVLEDCIYYIIQSYAPGTVKVFAQTKDGNVKTEELSVIVTGDPTNAPASEIEIEHNIVSDETDNLGRATIKVTITESVEATVTNEDLTNLLKTISLNKIKSSKPKGVYVYVYGEKDNIDNAFTIASCLYAPNGVWGDIVEANTSDYEGYDYSIDIRTADERAALRLGN